MAHSPTHVTAVSAFVSQGILARQCMDKQSATRALAAEILRHEGKWAYGLGDLSSDQAFDVLATWLERNPDKWHPSGEDYSWGLHVSPEALIEALRAIAIEDGYLTADIDLSGGVRPAYIHEIRDEDGGSRTVMVATQDPERALDLYADTLTFEDEIVFALDQDTDTIDITFYIGDVRRDVELTR